MKSWVLTQTGHPIYDHECQEMDVQLASKSLRLLFCALLRHSKQFHKLLSKRKKMRTVYLLDMAIARMETSCGLTMAIARMETSCGLTYSIATAIGATAWKKVLTQVVPHPTHINHSGNSTLIDLVLLSAPSQLVRCEVIPPLGNSDHNGINLLVKCFRNPPPVKSRKRTIWRYSHADFDQAHNLISAADWTFLDDETDMDLLLSMCEKRFMTIMEECIPKATISPRHNLPWMNRHIRSKIRKRNS